MMAESVPIYATKGRSWTVSRWFVTAAAIFAVWALEARAAGVHEEPPALQGTSFVCAQVVLAIDGSKSTQENAFRRQIEGVRAAFEREPLYRAIQDCLPGSVALAAITWSGADQQDLCLDWLVVTGRDDGHHLVERIDGCRYFGGSTDIGRAVDYGLRVLKSSPFGSYYRIVLVLTNGRTDRDAGASLAAARAQASAAGVTLAGFALLRPQPQNPSPFYVPDAQPLERYVAEHITTGPRSFTVYAHPADDIEMLLRAFAEMLRQEAG